MRINSFKLFLVITLCFSTFLFAQKIKIMPLGDSITKGFTGSPDQTGYRRLLHVLLSNAGYNVKFVGPSTLGNPTDFDRKFGGNGGWLAYDPDNSNNIAINVYNWLNNSDADMILLHIGSNDIDMGDPADTVINDINRILDEIDRWESTNKSVNVILAKIINRADKQENSVESRTLSEFNNKLTDLVNTRKNRQNPDKIVLVDMEKGAGFVYQIDNTVPYTSGDLIDNLHPNDRGYEKLANKWYSVLKTQMQIDPNPQLYLVSPEDASVTKDTSITFSWSDDPDATSYRFQLSRDPLFSIEDTVADRQNITSTSIKIDNLGNSAEYYWRVISVSSGQNINYSSVYQFFKDSLNVQPAVLTSPANNVKNIDTVVTFKWQAAQDASSYTLQIDDDSLFNSPIKNLTGITGTIKTVNGFNYGAKYFWRVISVAADGSSAFSEKWNYVTKLLPPTNIMAIATNVKKVDLSWNDKFTTETGFVIERKPEGGSYSKISNVPANTISYADTNVEENKTYYYRLKTVNDLTESSYSSDIKVTTPVSVNDDNKTPKSYALNQNYPNPFNPETTIKFSIIETGNVKLTVYNSIGKLVSTIVNEQLSPGNYSYKFNASEFSSGVYFYKLETNNFSQIKKMILLK